MEGDNSVSVSYVLLKQELTKLKAALVNALTLQTSSDNYVLCKRVFCGDKPTSNCVLPTFS